MKEQIKQSRNAFLIRQGFSLLATCVQDGAAGVYSRNAFLIRQGFSRRKPTENRVVRETNVVMPS